MSEGLTIRASSTSSWPDCPRRGAARISPWLLSEHGYKLNSGVSPIGATVGTATHAAVGHMMAYKAATGDLSHPTETEQVGLDALKEGVKQGVRYDGISPDLNTAEKQVLRQYKVYRIHLAPRIDPRTVEKRLYAKTAKDNTLTGAMDLTDHGIHDLKTGVAQRVNVAQYGVYSMLSSVNGAPAEHLTEDYVKRVSIRKEQPVPVQVSYDVKFAERVASSIIADIERTFGEFAVRGDKHVFLANPQSQLCSERYCSAYGTSWCPESHGKVAVAGVFDDL